jgi:uncharacterized protein
MGGPVANRGKRQSLPFNSQAPNMTTLWVPHQEKAAMEQVPSSGFSVPVVARFVDVATDALSAAREEIDALNVYPIPDGDTGTNMFLTMSAAREALKSAIAEQQDPASALRAFTRGALLGARGNSGVILSQLLGALVDRIMSADPGEPNAAVMANALKEATDASYAAVGIPVEGTILTVARAASDAALAIAEEPQTRARDVFAVAAEAARVALLETPNQLKVLGDAGVVDAGGRGLSVILDAAETVLTGRRPPPKPVTSGLHRHHTIPSPIPVENAGQDLSADGPAYEVMFLLDADAESVPGLRRSLGLLGDSVVVVGGGGLWNVHVHTDDVGAAIEAGLVAGKPYRIRVTHFAEQVAARVNKPGRSGRGVVAVAASAALATLFEEAGATAVVAGVGSRPSTQILLDAIHATRAAEVVVLPNDPDSVRVAEIAARLAEESGEVRVAVVQSIAQVQGLAAMAVHEPGRSFDKDVLEMTATARHVRHGAVTVAARQAMTMAGPCEPGDVLGVIAGDFAIVGEELYAVANIVSDRLLGGGAELVTLVSGNGEGRLVAQKCADHIRRSYPHVDVVVYDGGQERYPLLIGVE